MANALAPRITKIVGEFRRYMTTRTPNDLECLPLRHLRAGTIVCAMDCRRARSCCRDLERSGSLHSRTGFKPSWRRENSAAGAWASPCSCIRSPLRGTGTFVREVMAIPADLEQQHAALRERVIQSGLYQNEIAEFTVARSEYPFIAARAGVVADLGSLTTDESRNIVRKVRLADGRLAVLKVMGHRREQGEGEVLAAWTAKGLPCVRPLEWGYGQTSWVLTESAPSMATAPDPAGRAGQCATPGGVHPGIPSVGRRCRRHGPGATGWMCTCGGRCRSRVVMA